MANGTISISRLNMNEDDNQFGFDVNLSFFLYILSKCKLRQIYGECIPVSDHECDAVHEDNSHFNGYIFGLFIRTDVVVVLRFPSA